MTDEEMKAAWAETCRRLDRLERELGLRDANKDNRTGFRSEEVMKKKTALDRLTAKYRTFSTVSLIMIVVMACYACAGILPGEARYSIPLLFGLYFLMASVMDFWLYRGVSSIDVSTMTSETVAAKAYLYRKRHLQFVAVLLPIAFMLVGYFAYIMYEETYMMAAIVFGFIIGVAIGLIQFISFMSAYKALRSDL